MKTFMETDENTASREDKSWKQNTLKAQHDSQALWSWQIELNSENTLEPVLKKATYWLLAPPSAMWEVWGWTAICLSDL